MVFLVCVQLYICVQLCTSWKMSYVPRDELGADQPSGSNYLFVLPGDAASSSLQRVTSLRAAVLDLSPSLDWATSVTLEADSSPKPRGRAPCHIHQAWISALVQQYKEPFIELCGSEPSAESPLLSVLQGLYPVPTR